MLTKIEDLLEKSKNEQKSIAEIIIELEMQANNVTRAEVIGTMEKNYEAMENAIEAGIKGVTTLSGFKRDNGKMLYEYLQKGNSLTGDTFVKAICYAIATNEVNASMGIICATPTAGSAGVIPAVLFSIKERLKMTKEDCLNFLFTASAFGLCIANSAYISGAAGGCQAEIGSASGMAAAAATIAAGGTNEQGAAALAMAIKNMLGLICDPVAGLVEIPCITRNAAGASNALTAAEMALAGLLTAIPADEVVWAMKDVGERMHKDFKETGRGGLAVTPAGLKIEKEIFGEKGPNRIK